MIVSRDGAELRGEPVMAAEVAIVLRPKPSPNHSAFQLGWDEANLASIEGGWAVHLEHVGSDTWPREKRKK